MLDLDAPIIPGEGAAGIRVGSRIAELPADVLARFSVERRVNPCLPNAVLTLYRSDAVTLTVENRVIDQIEMHGDYRGRLRGAVGIGSTVAEVEARIGPVIKDGEDNLSIHDISGLCFEVDGVLDHSTPADDPILRPLPIKRIFVYRA